MKIIEKYNIHLLIINILYFISLFTIGAFLFNQIFVVQKIIPSNIIAIILLIIIAYKFISLKEEVKQLS